MYCVGCSYEYSWALSLLSNNIYVMLLYSETEEYALSAIMNILEHDKLTFHWHGGSNFCNNMFEYTCLSI